MILQLTSPIFMTQILDLAREVPDVPIETLNKMILSGLNDKDSIIYIDEKDGLVNGFIYASKEKWNGEEVCFIQFCVIKTNTEYSMSNDKYIGFEFMTKMRLWAKEKGLANLVMVTKRNPKLYERKYQFRQDGFVLKRGV